ncbi:MAG: GAF domain-containing protein [candidate division Zixibacteria bacterium]|nr:GAF domain-containing protein [candidate division Zixibacteria bacterium]
MSKVVIDFVRVSVFFTSLVLLLLMGKSYFRPHLEKWRVLAWGFVALSLGSAFEFVSNFQPFASLQTIKHTASYLSAALVFVYCLGILLVLGGLGSWLVSSFKSHQVAVNRLKQLTCFKTLLSVANHYRDPEEILRESLANFMLIMGYKKGVIFRSSLKSGEMELAAHWGFAVEKIHRLHNLSVTNPHYLEAKKSKEIIIIDQIRELPEYNHLLSGENGIKSFACVPLKYKDRVCGVMGIYDSKKDDFIYQETQFLSSWGNILGIIMEEVIGSRRNKLRRSYLNAAEDICGLVRSDSSLEEALPTLSKTVQKVIDFDYLCLALLDKSGENMRKLTIGVTGNLLLDKGVSLPTRGTPVEYVVRGGEALLDDDVYGDEKFIEDDLLRVMGVRSRLIIPLKSGRKVCATLTLGHLKHGYYTLADAKWLNLVASLLTIFVLREQKNLELEKTKQYSTCLDNIAQGTMKDESLDILFNRTATMITKDLPTTCCRIALLDQSRKKLDTKAVARIRNQGIALSGETEHSLSDLPWHRLALESRRSMLVNQDDPESLMSQSESKAVMTDKVRSALLVPLVVDDHSLGVISLGEERNWQRRPFTPEDMEFVKKVSLQLSIAIKDSYLTSLGWVSRRRIDQAKELITELSGVENPDQLISHLGYNLNDPLTSIIGSAELLSLKAGHLSPEVRKYANIIEKNANAIHAVVRKFVSLKNETTSFSRRGEKVLKTETVSQE